jgi:anthranilate phosphoribosyltransferase
MGIAFLFAPRLHPAMRQVMPVRRELGIRTLFNILGPLANPAGARRQVLGVYDERLVPLMAEVLKELGCDHALVVRGADGLDELTTTAATCVAEVKGDRVEHYFLNPVDAGLDEARPEDLLGGDPKCNAQLFQRVLEGTAGPLLDISLLNAGAAIYVAGRCPSLRTGVDRARQAVASGAAKAKLEDLRSFSPTADR